VDGAVFSVPPLRVTFPVSPGSLGSGGSDAIVALSRPTVRAVLLDYRFSGAGVDGWLMSLPILRVSIPWISLEDFANHDAATAVFVISNTVLRLGFPAVYDATAGTIAGGDSQTAFSTPKLRVSFPYGLGIDSELFELFLMSAPLVVIDWEPEDVPQ